MHALMISLALFGQAELDNLPLPPAPAPVAAAAPSPRQPNRSKIYGRGYWFS
ncbi:hypothetical protein [Schlesneria sp. DSM 10557]|uniref:hypothetical protein n=1 Tax=Schlesneria sp. DSM 10557 TaxID=3044399 RepID=UPI00359FA734